MAVVLTVITLKIMFSKGLKESINQSNFCYNDFSSGSKIHFIKVRMIDGASDGKTKNNTKVDYNFIATWSPSGTTRVGIVKSPYLWTTTMDATVYLNDDSDKWTASFKKKTGYIYWVAHQDNIWNTHNIWWQYQSCP